MSGTFTMFGRSWLISNLFIPTAVPLGDLYFALTAVVPGTSDSPIGLVEPPATGGYGYDRVHVVVNGSAFVLDAAGEVVNANVITFPTPTKDWGMIRGWAACTQVRGTVGDKVLAGGPVSQAKLVKAGVPAYISAGGARFTA